MNLNLRIDQKTHLTFNYTGNFDKEERKELVYYADQKEFENVERKARFTPKHKINFELGRRIFSHLKANLILNWTDKRVNYYSDYSNFPQIGYLEKTIKPHTNLELHLGQKLGSGVEINLSVINLLNEKIPAQFGNTIKDRDFPNPGRRVNVGLRFKI